MGRVVPGRRRFASAASAASAGSGAGSGGKSGGGVVNHYSASPAYKGRATHNVAYPIRDMDPASFSFADMLRANQRAYNAAHYPTTPVPAVYKAISKVTEAMMTVVYAGAFVAMGLIISTGVWAPVSRHARTHIHTYIQAYMHTYNTLSTTQHSTARHERARCEVVCVMLCGRARARLPMHCPMVDGSSPSVALAHVASVSVSCYAVPCYALLCCAAVRYQLSASGG